MATAKLWWNGSSWSSSSAYWVNESLSNSYANLYFKIQIIAYDDASIKLYGQLWTTHGTNTWSAIIKSGSKVIKGGSTTLMTLASNGASSTVTVTNYSSFSYSGTVATQGLVGTTGYNGATSTSSGSTTISSPFRTITYNANGGSGAPSSQTVCINSSSILSSTTPTRTGYSFLGWSTSDSATTASYTAGGSITVTANKTLYAVWQANSFTLSITKPNTGTVTILRNGSSFSGSTVYYDDVLTITASASAGYRILTLTVNGSDFTSGDTHTVTGAVAIVVTTIAQSSTIASYNSSVNTLDTFTLSVNRYSEDHYNILRYYDSNDNLLYTSAVFTVTTSLVIPQSWFANFPSDTTITITAKNTTYTDPDGTSGTETGVVETCTFTVTADSSMRPVLESGFLTLTPYNTGTGVANLTSPGFVKGYSKVQAAFDTTKITHASGATGAAYAITVQSISTSDSSTTVLSSNTLTEAGTLTVTYTVTDSRGRSTTGTETITVNDYSSPAIASLNCFRSDSTGTEDDDDNYMAITATCTYTSLSDNAITISVQVKPISGSYTSYGTLSNAIQSVIGGAFLADTTYIVRITVTDTVGNSSYTVISMPRRAWAFHIRQTSNGPGAAFGKITENDYVLQLASGWKFMMDSTVLTKAYLDYLLTLESSVIGSTALPTTAQTITGAIDELDTDISTKSDKPTIFSLSLPYANWAQDATNTELYYQAISVSGGTSYTKVDLQADATVIAQMLSDGVSALYVENNSGVFTAYAYGAALTADVTVQATRIETS